MDVKMQRCRVVIEDMAILSVLPAAILHVYVSYVMNGLTVLHCTVALSTRDRVGGQPSR